MARTRGASGTFDYSDGGELLGKGGVPIPIPGAPQRPPPIERVALDRLGNPISPAAYRLEPPRNISGSTVLHGPGAELVPPASVVAYQADRSTFARNMEAAELAMLLELMLGPISVRVTPEVFASLNPDLARHFRPLRQIDLPADEPVPKRRPARPRPDDDDDDAA